MEGLIEPQWWSGGTLGNLFRPRPSRRSENATLKKYLLLYVLVYIQQFGVENISVENARFVIAFRTIFEKSGGAIAIAIGKGASTHHFLLEGDVFLCLAKT